MSVQGTKPVWVDSFEATEAIAKYAVVVFHSDGKVKLPSAAKEGKIVGVVQEAAVQSGDVVPVVRIGTSLVNAAESGSIGNDVAIHDAAGMVGEEAGLTSGDQVLGHWEEAPNASGDQVACFVNPRTIYI